MTRVFLSYPRPMRDVVDQLVNDLRQSGYETYFDKELTGGQIWWDELLNRLEGADVFMPVICRAYLESTPCKLEAQHATACRKVMLPVQVEPVPAQLFPASVATAQWVSFDPDRQSTVFDIIRALNTLPPPAGPPVQPPPRPPAPISYMTEIQDEIHGPVTIVKDRQFVLIGELKSRLRTSDRDAAILLLRTLGSRNDLVYQAVMDINAVLAAEGVHGDSGGPGPFGGAASSQNRPMRQKRTAPSASRPPAGQPAYRVPMASSRARPAAWVLLGLGAVLLVLSLFAFDWLGAEGVTVKFSKLSSNLESRGVPVVAFVYFKFAGYALDALAVILALSACARSRRSTRLTGWSVAGAVGAAIACFLGTGVFSSALSDNLGGDSVSLEAGFVVCVVALLLLVVAVLIPRRRT